MGFEPIRESERSVFYALESLMALTGTEDIDGFRVNPRIRGIRVLASWNH
jgi:hypothetical protein